MQQLDIFENFGQIIDGVCRSMDRVIRATDHAIHESRGLRQALSSDEAPAPDDQTGDLFEHH